MDTSLRYKNIVNYLNRHGDVKLTGLYHNNWKWVLYARSLHGQAIIESDWLDYRKHHPTLYDLPDIVREFTYTGCIDAYLVSKNDKIVINLIFWEGDYHGLRTTRRCLFDITIPKELELHEDIISALKNHAEDVATRQIEYAEKQRLVRLAKKRAKSLLPL